MDRHHDQESQAMTDPTAAKTGTNVKKMWFVRGTVTDAMRAMLDAIGHLPDSAADVYEIHLTDAGSQWWHVAIEYGEKGTP
jgi:hypothetical protein